MGETGRAGSGGLALTWWYVPALAAGVGVVRPDPAGGSGPARRRRPRRLALDRPGRRPPPPEPIPPSPRVRRRTAANRVASGGLVSRSTVPAVILDALVAPRGRLGRQRRIDADLALTALEAAIADREPPPGCVHHSDRGSQYASELYRKKLAEHGLRGSMGRRGISYDNAKAESFMKTLKHEE